MSMRCDSITVDGQCVLSHPADIILSQVSGPTFNLLLFIRLLAKYLPIQPVRFIRVFFLFLLNSSLCRKDGSSSDCEDVVSKTKTMNEERLKKLSELQSVNFFSLISAL